MYAVAKFTQTESRGPTKKYLILAKIVRRAAVMIDNYVRSSNHYFLAAINSIKPRCSYKLQLSWDLNQNLQPDQEDSRP